MTFVYLPPPELILAMLEDAGQKGIRASLNTHGWKNKLVNLNTTLTTNNTPSILHVNQVWVQVWLQESTKNI